MWFCMHHNIRKLTNHLSSPSVFQGILSWDVCKNYLKLRKQTLFKFLYRSIKIIENDSRAGPIRLFTVLSCSFGVFVSKKPVGSNTTANVWNMVLESRLNLTTKRAELIWRKFGREFLAILWIWASEFFLFGYGMFWERRITRGVLFGSLGWKIRIFGKRCRWFYATSVA